MPCISHDIHLDMCTTNAKSLLARAKSMAKTAEENEETIETNRDSQKNQAEHSRNVLMKNPIQLTVSVICLAVIFLKPLFFVILHTFI